MGDQRLGEDWRRGMRVEFWSTWQKRVLEGVVTGRAYARDQRNAAIYVLEIDCGFEGPSEVVPWDQVTVPVTGTLPVFASIGGTEWAADELARDHGRVYVQFRKLAGGPL